MVVLTTAALAAPLSGEQLAGLESVDGVVLSPDGTAVVYALTERRLVPAEEEGDPAEWEVATQLWLVRGIGSGTPAPPRQLTAGEADAGAPQFSPDGRSLAFLRAVDDEPRLQVLPLDGGEALPVDTGELAPVAFAWAPDSRSFAILATEPETDAERDLAESTGGVERVGREFRSQRLWTVAATGGTPTRVGTVDLHVAEHSFSPDGRRLAVITAASGDPYEGILQTPQIVDLATGAFRPLDPIPRLAAHVRWSPDGTRVAWLSSRGTLTLANALLVAEADGPGRVDLAAKADVTLDDFAWTGADALVALITRKTRSVLVRFSADGAANQLLPGVADRTVLTGLSPDAAGARLATLAESPTVPAEPAWIDVGTNTSGIAAHPHDLAGWTLASAEVVTWKGPGGVAIEGVLTRPAGAAGALPLVVLPHGGPDGVSTEGFERLPQLFASHGYAVLQPNYRGGLGYGRDFYAANRGKLGEIEFGDIEAGVDALVKAGKVDPERLVYGGWSWGGYLTAWTIGHTGRYRAAVAGAAVVDTVSQYALSDINHGVAAEWEYLGDPWTAPKRFAASNPMASLVHARTPTLVVHGTADRRVDPSASTILWRALTDVGCETEYLRFPDEPHGFEDPRHVATLLDRWVAWYDVHLAGPSSSP